MVMLVSAYRAWMVSRLGHQKILIPCHSLNIGTADSPRVPAAGARPFSLTFLMYGHPAGYLGPSRDGFQAAADGNG